MLTKTLVRSIGIIFFISALLKAIDLTGFAMQISYYDIARNPLVVQTIAVVVIGLEAALGAALFLGLLLRRVTLPFVAALLLGFSILLVWALIFRDLKDCGCFGKLLPMTPEQSIAKNIVMLTLVIWVWAALGRCEQADKLAFAVSSQAANPVSSADSHQRALPSLGALPLSKAELRRLNACFAASLAAMGLAMGGVFLYRDPLATPEAKMRLGAFEAKIPSVSGKFARHSFIYEGKQLDLSRGVYLVAMLSDSCEHCSKIVSALNHLQKDDPSFPPIVGLILGEEGTLAQFRQSFQLSFPNRLIPPLEFFDLIGDAPPRFYIIHNGQPIKFWDAEMPDISAFNEAIVGTKLIRSDEK